MDRIKDIETAVSELETPAPADTNHVPGEIPTPQRPALLAFTFPDRKLHTSVGVADLTATESKAITKICVKAFKRSVDGIMVELSKGIGRKVRKPRAVADPSAPPKRRGRPPKAKTVVHEVTPNAVAAE